MSIFPSFRLSDVLRSGCLRKQFPSETYVVATGIDTYLGVEPYVSGSTEVTGLLTNGVRDWVEAAYTVEKDIDKLGDAMLARIEEKRAALGV